MSVELVLAAVSAADLCLKYGNVLIGVYRDIKEAHEAVQSKLLMVEAIWSKTAIQVEFVKRVARVLEEEHCRIHLDVLEALKSKLMAAISKIELVVKSDSGVRRWKYARLRETIDDSIFQLQQWQTIFDPSWYLILRMGNRFIDEELAKQSAEVDVPQPPSSSRSTSLTLVSAQSLRGTMKGEDVSGVHITLPEEGLDWNRTRKIEYSTTTLVYRRGSGKASAVDSIICQGNLDISRFKKDSEGLARKLCREGITEFGLLSCQGIIKRKDPETKGLASINLAFRLPLGLKEDTPVSLRKQLLNGRTSSLSRVLDIAKQLARAVSYIHSLDFVHKNIRPETILVFPDNRADSPSQLGSAHLVGFDSFRNVNFHTMRVGDDAWERNLYRHPTRQGVQAQDVYVMQHDVYSLGVCLLELGLWESFVEYKARGNKSTVVTIPGRCLGLNLDDFAFQPGNTQTARVKTELTRLAKSQLPFRMGDRYTSVVITCLTCLDPDNEDFGGEDMQDDDGILVGVRFIEKVLVRLGEISL
ncbi:hypothetical protein C8034_v000156 [Colletotrichum sidae]|uniref:Protein kinase domain-containing protein n=1 Tax=Colletotrichum sidae TaxID=1347389 RepID=A0A4V3I0I1_9PEZI|nr:hypothetical protein C8034_v000156 [Colletotrichum sidae]